MPSKASRKYFCETYRDSIAMETESMTKDLDGRRGNK